MESCAMQWAEEEFGDAELGHRRRTKRVVVMAARALERPGGRISDVFRGDAERQGAYCLVENAAVAPDELLRASQRATVLRCQGLPYVYVPVDGSSLSLTDRERSKDFGAVGALQFGARGLKVLGAIAVSPAGVPVGLTALQWWCREPKRRSKSRHQRQVQDKETQYWLDAIEATRCAFDEHGGPRPWFLLDREADSWPILSQLDQSGAWYTVRSRHDRRLVPEQYYLHQQLRKQRKLGEIRVDVAPGHGRKARRARLSVRAMTAVPLRLLDRTTGHYEVLHVNVVSVTEVRTTPRGERPLHWVLLTNHRVSRLCDAKKVVRGYAFRWRIEEFHKTWKSGLCRVEHAQLRKALHVQRWATILAAVAIRVERLKYLARNEPNEPATCELTELEIYAIKRAYFRGHRKTEPPPGIPTIADAVFWLAKLGGYTGKSSGGPPGSITIGRGLDDLIRRVETLQDLQEDGISLPGFD